VWRWRIFTITWLAYAGFYLTRKAFSVVKVSLQEPDSLAATTQQLAWVDFAYLTTYAIGQFVWGMSGDRFGTRRIILFGMLASVIMAVAMGASGTIMMLGVFFAIQGLCQSTGWAPLSKNVGQFFTQPERGLIMGFWCTNYAIGGFVASALAGWAADEWGWRYAFFVPAIVLLVIWVLFIFLQRNRPEDVGLPSIESFQGLEEETEASRAPGSWADVRVVLRTPMVWLLAAVYFCLKPTRYMVLFWSPTYINEQLGSNMTESGILGAMFDLAGPIAVLFGGFMSDKVFSSRRMPMCVIALIGLAVVLFFFRDLPSTRLALGLGFFAIGFLIYIPDSLVSGTAAIDFGGRRGASTAAGMINGFGSIGAIAGGTMPGWIESFIGPDGDKWGAIFAIMAISVVVAAVLLVPQWNRLPEEPSKADPDHPN
jgi:OPA family sugar phosphate sensor protein UhpC-like MFS transporter